LHKIRPTRAEDLNEIALLYRDTIQTVNRKDYTAEQVEAWSGRWNNIAGWAKRLNEQHFLLTEINGQISGFASVTTAGYVDTLFVHKDHQGKGVARLLISAIKEFADQNDIDTLTTDASITARPVFERFGFSVLKGQTVAIGSVELNNFKMIKNLK